MVPNVSPYFGNIEWNVTGKLSGTDHTKHQSVQQCQQTHVIDQESAEGTVSVNHIQMQLFTVSLSGGEG